MKKIVVLLFVLLFSSSSFSNEIPEDLLKKLKEYENYFSQIDGLWEGEIKAFETRGMYPDKPYHYKMRILIDQNSVRIFTLKETAWVEIAYDYDLVRHKTNAMINTQASSLAWVESVSIVVTLHTFDELHVLWQRAVNNFSVDSKLDEARGIFQHYALFKRLDKW